jgi:hypothetical protein
LWHTPCYLPTKWLPTLTYWFAWLLRNLVFVLLSIIINHEGHEGREGHLTYKFNFWYITFENLFLKKP